MKKWRTITFWVIWAAVAVLSLYDVVAISRAGSPATLSRVMLDMARDYPIVPFAFGVLIGHLYASQRPEKIPENES